MDDNKEYIKGLVFNGAESLSIEIKTWFDPDTPHGIAIIGKATLALRNNNGGFLIIGIDNNTGLPDSENAPENIHETFHPDKVQSIVSKYSSEVFEIKVEYVERDNLEIPVICVPGNIKTPVVSKSELRDKNGKGKILIGLNKVYMRSLSSNNTVSTTEIQYRDWDRLLSICFDNREADIGKFIRRHISSINTDSIKSIISQISEITIPKLTQNEILIGIADKGLQRFHELVQERKYKLPDIGFFEVSFIINGDIQDFSASTDFLSLMSANNPNLTGWPLWIDSRSFISQDSHPFVNNGQWEAILFDLESGWSSHIDYWFMNPSGKFYHIRGLEDDYRLQENKPEPLTALDFALPIWRVGEAITIAIAYSKALGCHEKSSSVDLMFRWTRLKDRRLSSWAQSSRHMPIPVRKKAYQDEVASNIKIPIDTPSSASHEYVYEVTKPLYEIFNGFELSKNIIEDIMSTMLTRRST